MFPKFISLVMLVALLGACAAPTDVNPAPVETLLATLPPTPAVIFPTETLAPTLTPEPTATPEAETITFLRSGVEEVTMLKKDTITFKLPNGEEITMPKIQMAGVEPGYNVDRLLEKALEFIVADGVAWGVLRASDYNYKPNNPNDPYSRYWNNFWFIPGIANRGTPIVLPNDNAVSANDRFEVGVVEVNNPNKGVVLNYKSDDLKHYNMSVFLVNADAEEVKSWLKSNKIKIPSRPDQ